LSAGRSGFGRNQQRMTGAGGSHCASNGHDGCYGGMTIRQYLRRRTDRYLTYGVVFLLIIGALMSGAPRILGIRIIFAVLIGVVLAAGFWSLVEIPCPNCLKSLGKVGFWFSLGRTRGVATRCPHCNISIDADMPTLPRV
jgi:hypothetical protein